MQTGILLFAGVFAREDHGFASEDFTADRTSNDCLFDFAADRGDRQAPIFCFRTCSSSAPIARARTFPTSPSGIEWRRRERSSWSCAWTFSSAVKRTAYLSAPSASVVPVSRDFMGVDGAEEKAEQVEGGETTANAGR
jgi:hypothetical protein